jgi:hypothetical protein
MTRFGKLNLLAMALPPAAAAIDGLSLFGASDGKAVAWMALLAFVPMIIAGPIVGLLIRSSNRKHGGRGASVALWATLIPAVFTALWYLSLAARPSAVAPGFESLAGPQYLLLGVIGMLVISTIGWFIARRA